MFDTNDFQDTFFLGDGCNFENNWIFEMLINAEKVLRIYCQMSWLANKYKYLSHVQQNKRLLKLVLQV